MWVKTNGLGVLGIGSTSMVERLSPSMGSMLACASTLVLVSPESSEMNRHLWTGPNRP